MKGLFKYSFLIVSLILSVATVSSYACEKDLIKKSLKAFEKEESSNPLSSQSESYFTVFNSSLIATGVERTSNFRVQPNVIKLDTEFSPSKISYLQAQLTQQKLYTTKSIYVSFYAEKQVWGYYIYGLRKLLI